MSYGRTQHHANHYYERNTSDDYQVYESRTEAMPGRLYDAPRYPQFHVKHWNNYEDLAVEFPSRERAVEYDFAPHHVKAAGHHVHVENIDKEADEFIKLEHKKFELSKYASMTLD